MNAINSLPVPNSTNSYYTGIKSNLHPTTIFVFGSNLAGRHGKGAAKEAYKNYGAIYGRSIGPMGNCYAIPTKDFEIKTLDLSVIKAYVDLFVKYTKDNPNLNFFVTAVGTGLAGYKDEDIAPMFKGAINCWFPTNWKQYLE